jgi:hypothetical protein
MFLLNGVLGKLMCSLICKGSRILVLESGGKA